MPQPLLHKLHDRGWIAFYRSRVGAFLYIRSYDLSRLLSSWPTKKTVPNWLFVVSAKPELEAGDRARTGDVQLGKLTFYH